MPGAVDEVALALWRRVHRHWAVFGWMGVPTVLVFLLSAVWSAMLAAIQLAPTAVANWLMGTEEFDFGDFWLLARADDRLAVPSAVLLIAFATAYIRVLCSSRQVAVRPTPGAGTGVEPQTGATGSSGPMASILPTEKTISQPTLSGSSRLHLFKVMRRRLISPSLQAYDSSVHALPKLVMQSATLVTYLRDGFPTALIFSYTTLLMINWLIACDRSLYQRPDPRFVLRRVVFSFDLYFAVLAPMVVLVYAYHHFAFDRDEFATRTATLSPATFDRTARLFADPTQVSLFRIAFQSLQLTTDLSVVIKVVLNVFTLRKWHQTIATLMAMERRSQSTQLSSRSTSRAATQRRSGTLSNHHRTRWERMARRLLAAVFATMGLGLFGYTVVSVVSSKHVCRNFTHCQVPSYRWNIGAQVCSCVVFVDRESPIRTYAEWLNLTDTTANLAALASTGDLRFVQIINRQVPVLPDELQRCRGLEQLILIHTRTLTVPDWASGLTSLQYLNIEGDDTSKQLTHMPPDLFRDMPRLQFVHLGGLHGLPKLPKFGKLPRLRYLVLAMLQTITEIPSLNHLHNLRQLSIINAIRVVALPSVSGLTNSNTFVLAGRVPACCNGFLTGTCDLTGPSCADHTAVGEALVTCTQERATGEDLARLHSTPGAICVISTFDLSNSSTGSAEMSANMCGGVKYKQCNLYGTIGICFPERMDLIKCLSDSNYIAMRRLQIERKVGDPCDPNTEAWLGCVQ